MKERKEESTDAVKTEGNKKFLGNFYTAKV